MKLQSIKVSEAKRSPTNPRSDKDFSSKEFKELVASIKEKGILVPVLVRALTGSDKVGKWEVIAGNRRLVAAKEAGLEEIPAQVVVMSDVEAMEAQIVENLQRVDIHPLEEGEGYRKLIEESKYEIVAIAAKVGKSDSYVKQRLFLTNLEAKPRDAYRSGKINDGHAVLIAKLSAGDQSIALKATVHPDYADTILTVSELKEWINENIYSPISFQPWVGSKFDVGACIECKPDRMSLFGEVKEGMCTDLKCWGRKMAKYIEVRAESEKLTKVSSEYGQSSKGVKNRGEYVVIAVKGKDRCESVHGAIVVQGSEIGHVMDICSDVKCAIHHGKVSSYSLTPAEEAKRKAERKAEISKAKKNKEATQKRLKDALGKVKWPMTDRMLEALLALAVENAGSNVMRGVAKRHELEMKKTKTEWGGEYYDYSSVVKKFIAPMDKTDKMKMVFELLIDTGYDSLRAGVGKL
jgi:ParB family chromosome partitioning protein